MKLPGRACEVREVVRCSERDGEEATVRKRTGNKTYYQKSQNCKHWGLAGFINYMALGNFEPQF